MVNDWASAMEKIYSQAIYESCNVADLEFSSGHRIEVRLALSDSQKQVGLSTAEALDMGMLFYYKHPTYIPFTMAEMVHDLDIGHYNSEGILIQSTQCEAGSLEHVTCSMPFSYVLEMPAGTLPVGNFRII